MLKTLLAGVALAAIALPFPAAAQVKDAPAAVIAVDTPSANLQRLFLESDEAGLKRNPLYALFRGDMRYADQFGDYVSDVYIAAEKAAAEADLAALARIDRAKLSPDEQISYDVFKWQRTSDLKGYEPAILKASTLRPIDHFTGLHQFVPDIFSGQSAAPFKTVKDYEDNLKRLDGFAVTLDGVLARMQQGVAAGVVQPKLVSERVLDQLNRHVEGGIDKMPLMMPVQNFPDSIPAAEQQRLRAAYAAKLKDVVMPSYAALRDYTRDTYLSASRGNDRPGLLSMPGGPELYRHLVAVQTTTDMTPEEIHQLGLTEVKRIHAEMDRVMKQVGFKGDRKAFFEYLRTDPKFKAQSREALTQGYYDIGKKVDVALPKLFSTMPKTPLEIRPYPPFLEKDSAGGSYMPGAPDGSRPGIFYFNAYDLPSRTTPGMETLYLHEGAPGHHFQIALAQENAALPSFQRFGGNTAYAEGWGLYAESLGKELGMFTDPYQYFGRLDDEMLRAMRLVVDTGLHYKGWSRQQAIDYMLANSSQGQTDVVNEVDRYVAMPAQALAYKVGDLRIQGARKRAEKALGKDFDIRKFHEQVLMSGALPLEVLDAKIDRWIAAGGK
ncbi:DUF885 domain-containing protein [Sandaracinobacter sp. RS1-74]|uniref:DUF885 domain-containing protein n=1 Tax=Sandaracinobacteroides sayramensis TaxID=2913411 RepID=UPI001EDAFDF4|nr:DUF885 domain-containing protein [Sandaracinobacteroides sayramensis]MCG2842669.1 DUF885 domain-containing protein [Sandaracinobacteroides sayramensis]